MKAVAAFVLVLCCLAISDAWKCKEGPRLYNAMQIDCGLGKVVVRDRNYYLYFLMGYRWYRMSGLRFKHGTIGPGGLWAASTRNVAHKCVAGNFVASKGLLMQQLDAGGDHQIVGVSGNRWRGACLRSPRALYYNGVGSLGWNYLPRALRYIACGPDLGCWGIDTSYRVIMLKYINPKTCGNSGWYYVSGPKMRMIEVGTDGTVVGVSTAGHVYIRAGINKRRPHGTRWVYVPMCMSVRHVCYDLGYLWTVTTSGLIMTCRK